MMSDLVAMRPNVSSGAGVPSNPALAFSQVTSEPAPNPAVVSEPVYCSEPIDIGKPTNEGESDPVVIPEPVLRSEPVSINVPRPGIRRLSKHGERT